MSKIVGKNIGDMPGTIKDFAGTLQPNYILCDGSPYSALAPTISVPNPYYQLFLNIGYAWGGSGSTFNVPDSRGAVGAGVDTDTGTGPGSSFANRLTSGGAGIDSQTIGASGGQETHSLDIAELASHTHTGSVTVSSSGSSGTVIGFSTNGGGSNPSNPVIGGSGTNGVTNGSETFTGSVATSGVGSFTTASTGSGTAHQNTQPTLVVTKMIKY
jgi:microcystin-dependent protein